MFTQVAELFHDLDAGMLPVSVLFPYLPIPAHRRRDRCARFQANAYRRCCSCGTSGSMCGATCLPVRR